MTPGVRVSLPARTLGAPYLVLFELWDSTSVDNSTPTTIGCSGFASCFWTLIRDSTTAAVS